MLSIIGISFQSLTVFQSPDPALHHFVSADRLIWQPADEHSGEFSC